MKSYEISSHEGNLTYYHAREEKLASGSEGLN